MQLKVNGEDVTINVACNVHELLTQRGRAKTPCAVEVNGRLVPKRDHQSHTLREGDTVEIVTLVGGG